MHLLKVKVTVHGRDSTVLISQDLLLTTPLFKVQIISSYVCGNSVKSSEAVITGIFILERLSLALTH